MLSDLHVDLQNHLQVPLNKQGFPFVRFRKWLESSLPFRGRTSEGSGSKVSSEAKRGVAAAETLGVNKLLDQTPEA